MAVLDRAEGAGINSVYSYSIEVIRTGNSLGEGIVCAAKLRLIFQLKRLWYLVTIPTLARHV